MGGRAWTLIGLVVVIACACGPNAMPVDLTDSASSSEQVTITPVAWKTPTPVPTPPPSRATATPVAATAKAVAPPTPAPTAAPKPFAPPAPAAKLSPTASLPRPPVPTPTPDPPVTCQFNGQTLSVPINPSPTSTAPSLAPSGASTLAAGEPMPGVFLDLQLPVPTTLIAGGTVIPDFVVRNTSTDTVALTPSVSVEPDQPVRQNGVTPDPRAFPSLLQTGPPGAYETRVPPGQTRTSSSMAQLPFDATVAVHLHASAGLGLVSAASPASQHVVGVVADIPLRLRAPLATDQLTLDLKADRQQWCLHATVAGSGDRPTGPLFIRIQAKGTAGTLFGNGVTGETGDAWAQRWSRMGSPSLVQSAGPVTLTLWVAGPHYVTARADTTIPGNP